MTTSPGSAKAAKRLEKGDRWVENMLFTLERGCGVGGFTADQDEECEELFNMVANLLTEDPAIQQDELIMAQGGDYKLFEKLDTEKQGFVTLDQWMVYLRQKHAQIGKKKVEKGDRWLKNFLFTLRVGCGDVTAQEDVAEQREA